MEENKWRLLEPKIDLVWQHINTKKATCLNMKVRLNCEKEKEANMLESKKIAKWIYIKNLIKSNPPPFSGARRVALSHKIFLAKYIC